MTLVQVTNHQIKQFVDIFKVQIFKQGTIMKYINKSSAVHCLQLHIVIILLHKF